MRRFAISLSFVLAAVAGCAASPTNIVVKPNINPDNMGQWAIKINGAFDDIRSIETNHVQLTNADYTNAVNLATNAVQIVGDTATNLSIIITVPNGIVVAGGSLPGNYTRSAITNGRYSWVSGPKMLRYESGSWILVEGGNTPSEVLESTSYLPPEGSWGGASTFSYNELDAGHANVVLSDVIGIAANAVPSNSAYVANVALAQGALQRSEGKSVTNSIISSTGVTNTMAFVGGQLITWTTNGVSL